MEQFQKKGAKKQRKSQDHNRNFSGNNTGGAERSMAAAHEMDVEKKPEQEKYKRTRSMSIGGVHSPRGPKVKSGKQLRKKKIKNYISSNSLMEDAEGNRGGKISPPGSSGACEIHIRGEGHPQRRKQVTRGRRLPARDGGSER